MRPPIRPTWRPRRSGPGRHARWSAPLAALALVLLALLAPGIAVAQDVAAPTAAPVAPSAVSAPTAGVVVPAGSRASGVVVLRGPLDVFGTVEGTAIAVDDITVHPGARVTGDVISILGTVRAAGGTVAGQVRAMDGQGAASTGVSPPPREGAAGTAERIGVVTGWLVMLLVIGIGVLVIASQYLDGVAEALEVSLPRALGVGIAGQMLILPALLGVVVALAITIVGVLAIPLAVVLFVLGAAGLVTLGFLAVAFVTGRSLAGRREPTARCRAAAARGDAVRALTLGLVVYLAIWFAAEATGAIPVLSVVLRTFAIGVTWMAATAGFGAALISRAGTRQPQPAEEPTPVLRPEIRRREPALAGTVGGDRTGVPVWQTPTPISGIVAARRPTTPPPPAPRDS